MRYEEDYTPRIGDYDSKGAMFLPAILKILEDIAAAHAAHLGEQVIDEAHFGKSWFIIGWDMEILRRPLYPEPLHVRTWVRSAAHRSSVIREFDILDEKNVPCVRAISKMSQFDYKTGRVAPIEAEALALYSPEEDCFYPQEDIPRLREPESFLSDTNIHLRRSDFDFNNHVHNLSYLLFAMEALPESVYQKNDFQHLSIVFRKSIQPGEEVVCRYAEAESGCMVCIYGGDGVLRALTELR